MFAITVDAEFCAAHSLTIAGQPEETHGHNFRIRTRVEGPCLDRDGLLCDFHAVERALHEVIGPLHNKNLNQTNTFLGVNPSAENLARHIADELCLRLHGVLPQDARVAWVRVSEAPGCYATYEPDAPRPR